MSREQNFVDGIEIVHEDFLDLQRIQREDMINGVLLPLLNSKDNGFFGEGYLASVVDPSNIQIAPGVLFKQIGTTESSVPTQRDTVILDTAENIQISSPDANNPRLDAIYVNASFIEDINQPRKIRPVNTETFNVENTTVRNKTAPVFTVVTGTPSAAPVEGTAPNADALLVATVLVEPVNGVVSVNDRRVILNTEDDPFDVPIFNSDFENIDLSTIETVGTGLTIERNVVNPISGTADLRIRHAHSSPLSFVRFPITLPENLTVPGAKITVEFDLIAEQFNTGIPGGAFFPYSVYGTNLTFPGSNTQPTSTERSSTTTVSNVVGAEQDHFNPILNTSLNLNTNYNYERNQLVRIKQTFTLKENQFANGGVLSSNLNLQFGITEVGGNSLPNDEGDVILRIDNLKVTGAAKPLEGYATNSFTGFVAPTGLNPIPTSNTLLTSETFDISARSEYSLEITFGGDFVATQACTMNLDVFSNGLTNSTNALAAFFGSFSLSWAKTGAQTESIPVSKTFFIDGPLLNANNINLAARQFFLRASCSVANAGVLNNPFMSFRLVNKIEG